MELSDYITQSKNPKFNDAFLQLVEIIQTNIPSGFQWGFGYGMFGYDVPFERYPQGYHVNSSQPLPFLGLAIQKQHLALYHMGLYMDGKLLNWFVDEYNQLDIGKLDMGKSCIRFKNPKKIPFELIGKLVSKQSVDDYITLYELELNSK